MKRQRTWLILTLLPTLLFAGCSRQIVQADNPTALSTDQYKLYFDATLQVLRDNGYVIDRRDYRFGQITTRPQGSPNLVEVWNPQNTTADQAIESTFASEQRLVNVSFSKDSQTPTPDTDTASNIDTGYMIEVQVILERKQIPTRRMAGSARRNVFSNLAAPPRNLIDRGVTASYWEPVGRDEYLEARLIKQITAHANTSK